MGDLVGAGEAINRSPDKTAGLKLPLAVALSNRCEPSKTNQLLDFHRSESGARQIKMLENLLSPLHIFVIYM